MVSIANLMGSAKAIGDEYTDGLMVTGDRGEMFCSISGASQYPVLHSAEAVFLVASMIPLVCNNALCPIHFPSTNTA